MRLLFAVLMTFGLLMPMAVSPVAAQATCRQKCIDEEQACLKRTGNKGQCGDRAQTCVSNCRRN
jgi:hypothetical protein